MRVQKPRETFRTLTSLLSNLSVCGFSTLHSSPPSQSFMDDPYSDLRAAGGPREMKPKRIRNWTAHDRAAHRVFERGRREAFNNGLIVSCIGTVPS